MTLKDYFKKAQREKFAIGQFNFSTLEQLRGILAAAERMKSPVILGTSQGESKYLGIKEIVALVEISKMKYNISAFLNLDHGKDLDYIKKAIDFGYSAVHFDGSDLSLEKNMKYAKRIVEYAHKKDVLVEGELDPIKKQSSTSLKEAEKFIKETKVDSLAIAIGSVHGMHKNPKLDFERLKEINSRIDTFLVLHGGSGIPDVRIRKAIKLGILKININTELRLAWKRTLAKSLKTQEIKPYKILAAVQEVIQETVEKKLKLFNNKT